MELCSIEHRFPEHKLLVIHPLSDVHIEATTHREADFKRKIEELISLPLNHRILLMGDLMDAAIASSKGFYHGAKTVEWALDALVKTFEPLRNKIDLIIPGNHEERVGRVAGVDITRQFATLIGKANVFRPLPTVVHYAFYGKSSGACQVNAQGFIHHGHGGGNRPGSAVNRMEDLAKWKSDCDFYLMGHVHRKFANADVVYTGWPVREHKRMFVCTGTFLGHEHYAQKFGLAPQRAEGSPVITIKRKGHIAIPAITAEV